MALVTAPGDALSDSYATVSFADAYFTAVGKAQWTGNVELKEQALRRAAIWLDGTYARSWPGTRTFPRTQLMDWPRVDAYDLDNEIIDPITVPVAVMRAQCEAALRELVAPGSLSPDVVPGQLKVLTGLKGITWTPQRASAGPSDMVPTLTAVRQALSRLIASGGSIKIVRA